MNPSPPRAGGWSSSSGKGSDWMVSSCSSDVLSSDPAGQHTIFCSYQQFHQNHCGHNYIRLDYSQMLLHTGLCWVSPELKPGSGKQQQQQHNAMQCSIADPSVLASLSVWLSHNRTKHNNTRWVSKLKIQNIEQMKMSNIRYTTEPLIVETNPWSAPQQWLKTRNEHFHDMCQHYQMWNKNWKWYGTVYVFFWFLSFRLDITLIKCLKGLNPQKSILESLFLTVSHLLTQQG